MIFVAKAIPKPVSMATNGCLISTPSLFTPSKISCSLPSLSIRYKPVSFQLCCKNLSSLSLPSLSSRKREEPLFTVCVLAAQEENNLGILGEREEDEQEFLVNFKWDASTNEENEREEGDVAVEAERDGSVKMPDLAKLYVGNLPYDVDDKKLAMLFEQSGTIDVAEVIYSRETGQSRGFGFVKMSTPEEAQKAVEMFQRYDLRGRLLTVNIAALRGSQPERAYRAFGPSYKIYVGNLSWSVDSERLEQLFSEHGKVVSARLISDMESGRSRGFGFVAMSSESEMNNAIAKLDGQNVDGRAIRVNAAQERPRHSRF